MDEIKILIILCMFSIASVTFLVCFVTASLKRMENKLDAAISFMRWVKSRNDTTYISMLASIQQYFVRQEMYYEAAKIKKIIEKEMEDIDGYAGSKEGGMK